jgi:hypothetical protein
MLNKQTVLQRRFIIFHAKNYRALCMKLIRVLVFFRPTSFRSDHIVMTRTFEVLSSHKTIAEYAGVEHRECMFLTSLCPDRCNHPKDFARFKIVSYEAYEKKDEYGDEQKTTFAVDINPAARDNRQDAAILERIKNLAVGQKIKLFWEQIYVTQDGSQFPERIIRSLELI